MKKFILLISLFIPLLLVAGSGYQNFQTGQEYYLLADNVNIRSSTSTSSKIVAKLPIATKVIFKQTLPTMLTVGNLTTNWVKIAFKHPTTRQQMQGYVWGGFIAEGYAKSESNPSLSFLYGLSSIKNKTDIYLQIRVVKNQKEIDKIVFKAVGGKFITSYVETFSNVGISKIHDVLNFTFTEEMSGGINEVVIFYWDGKKTHLVKQFDNSSDAPFYTYSSFVYPTDDGGKQGRIILRIEKGGVDDAGEEYKNVKKEEYYWTGTQLQKIN